VFDCQGNHGFVTLGTHHDGVDQRGLGRIFIHLESLRDGIDIGCIQCQGNIVDDLLDCFNHPGHQLMSILFGRPEVDVNIVHTLFALKQGLFLDRLGISFLIGGADLFGYYV
jgi:hypothetical protein